MGAAAYNRGSKAISAQIDRELKSHNRPCNGVMYNGPNKRYARCSRCGRIDYEQNEGDRCRVVFIRDHR
jgi:hypothetical protein